MELDEGDDESLYLVPRVVQTPVAPHQQQKESIKIKLGDGETELEREYALAKQRLQHALSGSGQGDFGKGKRKNAKSASKRHVSNTDGKAWASPQRASAGTKGKQNHKGRVKPVGTGCVYTLNYKSGKKTPTKGRGMVVGEYDPRRRDFVYDSNKVRIFCKRIILTGLTQVLLLNFLLEPRRSCCAPS